MSVRLTLARVGFRWRLAAALTCLLVAVVSGLDGRASPARGSSGRTVLVAAHALPAGHRLTARDLRPARLAWPGGVSRPGRLVGATLAGPLARGEPISPLRLVDRSLTTGLGPGLVALPLDIGTDVRGLVRAGTRVDLLAVPAEGSTDDDNGREAGRVAAARVLVLALLPPTDSNPGCRVVLAVGRDLAPRIAGAGSSRVFRVAALAP